MPPQTRSNIPMTNDTQEIHVRENDLHNAEKLLDMICGNWRTQAIGVAVELRIFDLLTTGPKTIDELARNTRAATDPLRRFMRALVTLELVTEQDSVFRSTELGRMLSRDAPDSLWAWGEWYAKHIWTTWGNLLYSVQTGESARKMLAGLRGYDHVTHDAEAAFVFNMSMTQMSLLVTQALLQKYQFPEHSVMVDVGGGYGELLVGILDRYPRTKGVLMDLEHAIEGAKTRLATTAVFPRITYHISDFFQAVPTGGDYYLLKSILHNWNDERAALILSNIRKAMKLDSTLLCLERLIPDAVTPSFEDRNAVRSDLNMLVGFGGRERSLPELRSLFLEAGLKVRRTIQLSGGYCVVEGACG